MEKQGDIEKIRQFIELNNPTLVEAKKVLETTIGLIHRRLLRTGLNGTEQRKALEIACRSLTDPVLDYYRDYLDILYSRYAKNKPTKEEKRPEYIG